MRWVAFIQITTVLLLAIPVARPEYDRRSLMDFKTIISVISNRTWLEFMEYGRYCGLGGEGKPVDELDECCHTHDICYVKARKENCPPAVDKYVFYSIQYKYKITDNDVECILEGSNPCEFANCNCDVTAARCMRNAPYVKENKRPITDLIAKVVNDKNMTVLFREAIEGILEQFKTS